MRLFSRLFKLMRDEDGPTAVEYAIMLALIIAICFSSVWALGRNKTRRDYRKITKQLKKANSSRGS